MARARVDLTLPIRSVVATDCSCVHYRIPPVWQRISNNGVAFILCRKRWNMDSRRRQLHLPNGGTKRPWAASMDYIGCGNRRRQSASRVFQLICQSGVWAKNGWTKSSSYFQSTCPNTSSNIGNHKFCALGAINSNGCGSGSVGSVRFGNPTPGVWNLSSYNAAVAAYCLD